MSLKILFPSSEVAPFRKTGGLGDVSGALPKALSERGLDVKVVMPLYRGISWDELETLDGTLEVPMYYGTGRAGVRMGYLPGSRVPIYFIDHPRYFDRAHVYGPPEGGYPDNLERFAFFSRASLELALALGFVPDVVHAHDWQTALVSVYLNASYASTPLHRTPSLFTIHNLAFQGISDPGSFPVTGLPRERYNARELEHFGAVNLMKGALAHATLLSTVSPTYAEEIQRPEHGFGLDGVIASRRSDLHGILNGIDDDEWSPATDAHLPARYDAAHLEGKSVCKKALQEAAGLPLRSDVPLFAAIGRLTPQKGFDYLAEAMDRLLEWDLQLVLLGTGDSDAEAFFASVSRLRSDKFHAWIGFDGALAHRIEAGCDFFLMPSRFEPCGLNQMYSLRYGSPPVVHAVGGLADTVSNYDERSDTGTGFVFYRLDAESLANTVAWVLSTYRERPARIDEMRRRGMAIDFSWRRAASRYEELYREAIRRRAGVRTAPAPG
jgi:starch synthase